jgi:site-specific DNA recombinase
LLKSRVYLGEIVHGDERYPGAHAAIVGRELFEDVQAQVASNARARQARPTASSTLALQGLIFDVEGHRMVPSFAYGKSGKRHAYYVSAPLQRAIKPTPGVIGRISAKPLEALVLERLRTLSAKPRTDWPELLPLISRIDVEAHGIRLTLDAKALLDGGGKAAMSQLESRLCSGDRLSSDTRNGHTLQLIVPVRPIFRGGRTWMVRPDGQAATVKAAPDALLLKGLAQAHAAAAACNAAPSMSLEQWRRAKGQPDSFLRRLMSLAFLAPEIQRAMLEGRQPAGLSATQLTQAGVPLAWADQRQAFGL